MPHLHIEAHASSGRAAPSIPLAFALAFGGGSAAHEDDAAHEGTAAPAYAAAAPQPPPPPPTSAAARHFVPTAGRWYDARGEVAAPLPARTLPIAHGDDGGLPSRPRGEPSESGDGSSSSGWETVEEGEEEEEEAGRVS